MLVTPRECKPLRQPSCYAGLFGPQYDVIRPPPERGQLQ
jgi:hypothetical protein